MNCGRIVTRTQHILHYLWPWLGPSLTAMQCYVVPVLWIMFSHNGANGSESKTTRRPYTSSIRQVSASGAKSAASDCVLLRESTLIYINLSECCAVEKILSPLWFQHYLASAENPLLPAAQSPRMMNMILMMTITLEFYSKIDESMVP